MRQWISKGAAPEKLILGIATYGTSFRLASSNSVEPGSSAVSAGSAGPVIRF